MRLRCIFKHKWKIFPNNKGRMCVRCGKEQIVKDNKYKTIKSESLGSYL